VSLYSQTEYVTLAELPLAATDPVPTVKSVVEKATLL
jgi:hypothetical protein